MVIDYVESRPSLYPDLETMATEQMKSREIPSYHLFDYEAVHLQMRIV